MRIFVCIDDTDNIDSRGTGELASIISKAIKDNEWGRCYKITRHQLFIHPDVPYTSHNSSMCFEADISEEYLEPLIAFASEFLSTECAEGSDPGLCVAVADKINIPEPLFEFGKRAKSQLVTKKEAYELASQLGIHLSEHGGTGDGVIGAIAGVGLRMSGNDGRFKGSIKFETEEKVISVGYILSQTYVESVKSIEGTELDDNEEVVLGKWVKPVLFQGRPTLFVFSKIDELTGRTFWETTTKQQLSAF